MGATGRFYLLYLFCYLKLFCEKSAKSENLLVGMKCQVKM